MASVAVTAGVVGSARRVVTVVGAHVSTVQESDNRGDGKEDNVHDTKRPAGLEHSARLVVDKVVAGANDTNTASRDIPVVGAANANAVGVSDVAQVVNGSDEGAEEEGVNECDKVGVGRGAVVAEESEDCPCESENGNDEEDEDRVGSQGVLLDEAIDEPGEHAHTRDLRLIVSLVVVIFSRWCFAYQSDDLKDPEENEEHCEKHLCGLILCSSDSKIG